MKSLHIVALATAFIGLLGPEVQAGSVTLTGSDLLAGNSYSTAQLAGLAVPGNTVNFNGLKGISLWGLLGGSDTTTSTTNAAGTTKNYGQIVTFNPAGANSNQNFDLRYYVVGSGDGAASAVSLGQIDPAFAGSNKPAPFIAFESGGNLLASPQLVIPGAPASSTIQNLSNLDVRFVPALPPGPGGPSTGVTISGNVTSPNTTYSQFPGTFTPANLSVLNAINQVTNIYSGIPLATFLNVPSGVDINSQIVVATATDNYQVVYSLLELLKADGTADPNVLLAYAATGTDFPGSGIARTVVGSDGPFKHGRWNSNLESLAVIDTTPLPGTLPLFVTGLGMLGFVAHRRKQKAVTV